MINMTPEQHKVALEARQKAYSEAVAAYNQQLPEDELWKRLAKKKGVKLARSTKAPTPIGLGKFARAIGYKTEEEWKEALFGHEGLTLSTTACIKRQNQRKGEGKWESLREMQGYLLESVALPNKVKQVAIVCATDEIGKGMQ